MTQTIFIPNAAGDLSRAALSVGSLLVSELGRSMRYWRNCTSQPSIIEDVFARYAPQASWRLTDEVAQFVADAPRRRYCVQLRETDAAFVERLMAEEGLGYTFEECGDAPAGHRLVVFADSCSFPYDPSAKANGGLRFHRASSQEQSDAMQTLVAERTLQPALTTLVSYDYRTKKAIAAELPSAQAYGSRNAPRLESYDVPGAEAFACLADAERAARLMREASEAQTKIWQKADRETHRVADLDRLAYPGAPRTSRDTAG